MRLGVRSVRRWIFRVTPKREARARAHARAHARSRAAACPPAGGGIPYRSSVYRLSARVFCNVCSYVAFGRRRLLAANCSMHSRRRIFFGCIWSIFSAHHATTSGGIRKYFPPYSTFADHECRHTLWIFSEHFYGGVVSVCANAGLCAKYLRFKKYIPA